MTTAEIEKAILNGTDFANEAADWFTLFKPSENRFIIVVRDKYRFYLDARRAARAVSSLINRGN